MSTFAVIDENIYGNNLCFSTNGAFSTEGLSNTHDL